MDPKTKREALAVAAAHEESAARWDDVDDGDPIVKAHAQGRARHLRAEAARLRALAERLEE